MVDNIGIVICSRTDSKRLPNKPFIKVAGKYVIAHLLDRLIHTGIPVYIAVPKAEIETYRRNLSRYINNEEVFLVGGEKSDPLKRTYRVAKKYGLDYVVRINHDKIFVSQKQLDFFVEKYVEGGFDYLYSTNFIPGMSFEIFSSAVLEKAQATFKNVEHISYAVEAVAQNVGNLFCFPYSRTWLNRHKPNADLRLLIDYPEDIEAITKIMDCLGPSCSIKEIVKAAENKTQKNSLPEVTVYTCSFNDVAYLDRCAQSVLSQSLRNIEYILIDDGSKNERVLKAMETYLKDGRVRVIRNAENMGLASSSNVANDNARGRYVIRLDADDYFVDEKVLERMRRHMDEGNADILYPNNYKDGKIQKGCDQHHVGGTMFKKRTLDYLRFTDGLRHFEGLDLYHRAMLASRRIDYFSEPTFYYRQRSGSLSKQNTEARREIERKIKSGVLGSALTASVANVR